MTYMQPYELDAWLGDTELTDEQRATFARTVEAIADRYCPGKRESQLDICTKVHLSARHATEYPQLERCQPCTASK